MKLDLGSGRRKIEGHIGLDIQERVGPDMVCDVSRGLPFRDSSVDAVRAFDFLEHIIPDRVIFVLEEIWRVLKPWGTLEHLTPSTDGRGAWQDPTHRSFWNINSWLYFTEDVYRDLYGIKAKFEVETLRDVQTGENIIHTYGVLYAVK